MHLDKKLLWENLANFLVVDSVAICVICGKSNFSAKICGSNFQFNCSYNQNIQNDVPVAVLDIEGFLETKE